MSARKKSFGLKRTFIKEEIELTKEIEENYSESLTKQHFGFHIKTFLGAEKGEKGLSHYFCRLVSDGLNVDSSLNRRLPPQSNIAILTKDSLDCAERSTLTLFKLLNDIKFRYPLIYNSGAKLQVCPPEEFIHLVIGTAEHLNSLTEFDASILKKTLKRFGLNSVFTIFVMTRVKNSEAAKALKLKILCKLIKKYLQGEESSKYLGKISFNSVRNLSREKVKELFYSGVTPSVMKGSMLTVFRDHVFKIIFGILYPQNNQEEFRSFLYDKLFFLTTLATRKWRIINEALVLDYTFKEDFPYFLLQDCLKTAEERPFLFLSYLEDSLNVNLAPFTKYLSCFNVEKFINEMNSFTKVDISPIKPVSFFSVEEIVEYNLQSVVYSERKETKIKYHQQKKSVKTEKIRRKKEQSLSINPINKYNITNTGMAFRKDGAAKGDMTQESSKFTETQMEVDVISCLPEELCTDILYKTVLRGNQLSGIYRRFVGNYVITQYSKLKEFVHLVENTLIDLICVDSSESIIIKFLFYEFLYVSA